MAKMDAMMKACMKPHALVHILTGVGIGMLLVGLFSGLVAQALMLGIILLVVGVGLDFAVNKGE